MNPARGVAAPLAELQAARHCATGGLLVLPAAWPGLFTHERAALVHDAG
jgi:hypothetical protein